MDIKVEMTNSPKPIPDGQKDPLSFGKISTDHMFLMDYNPNDGWHNARIVPYGPLQFDPSTSCLHYGQLIFEGMKAYKAPEGKVLMFRPLENAKRLNDSSRRMCMPETDPNELVKAIAKLVDIEQKWIPTEEGTSLYIRPFVMGVDNFLGVNASQTYLLCVMLCPVGLYFPKPVRIYVEDEYVRAVAGGTGAAKAAGNYAGSMRAQVDARERGFDQVLWLDGVHRKYIEEVGAMNVFFVIDGIVVTPELSGSILPGITRKSIIELLGHWSVPVVERQITIDELADAYKAGRVSEAFGAGTAAVISPVGEIVWKDVAMKFGDDIGPMAKKIKDEMVGIQTGNRPDPFGWVYEVC